MGAKHTLAHIYTAEKHSHTETVSKAPKHQEGYAGGDKLTQTLTSRKHTMKTPVLYKVRLSTLVGEGCVVWDLNSGPLPM